MREFRIKVNNEKTYVVKAKDYNQAVKTLHSKLRDFDLTNFLALKRSLELRIGEEIDFDKLEEYVNKLPKDKNGKKNVDVKEVIKCCIKAKDNAVNDSISKYNGEDAIKTNGFVKIKEDGYWTSYKYNGSDFDDAVFKIHQYNPSLIAFISNGNKTITVRNKYLNDAADTAQGEIEVLKSFGFDYKDGRWVKESNSNDIIVQPDYHYVSVIGPGDTEKHCKKYQYQSAGMLKKIIASNIKDSSISDKLIESGSKEALSKNIATEIKAGKDPKQAAAIAYSVQRENDSSVEDSDSYQVWTINEKGVYHKEADVPNPQLARAIASQLKKQGRWVQISKNSKTNIVSDCNMMDSLSIKVKLNGKTYKGVFNGISNAAKTFGDVYIPELVSLHSGDKGVFNPDEGNYVSDGKFYFKMENLKKWNPFLNNYLTDSDSNKRQQLKAELDKLDKEWDRLDNLGRPTEHITAEMEAIREELKKLEDCSTVMTKDADPVKVEKIIRKEKSALGITYYLFQTKSKSGATIYYEVTDKHYHGEPTYSGGGIISFSLQSANDSLDSHLLSDKLEAKYGEKEGTKRYLRGENDSAIKDKLSTSDANSLVEAYIDKYKYTHSNLPYVNKPKIKIFNSPEEFRDKFLSSHRSYSIYAGGLLNYNGYVVKLFTSAKDGKIENPSTDNIFTIFPSVPVKDSNNIKNRKSYTIKVGDKQYKVFAESESEAINKYIKSKKQ